MSELSSNSDCAIGVNGPSLSRERGVFKTQSPTLAGRWLKWRGLPGAEPVGLCVCVCVCLRREGGREREMEGGRDGGTEGQ